MYTITFICNEGARTYSCEAGEDVLTAARRNGIYIPTGCRSGGCGMCKVKVREGRFQRETCSKAVLTDAEREKGFTLTCKTFPESDLTVEWEK